MIVDREKECYAKPQALTQAEWIENTVVAPGGILSKPQMDVLWYWLCFHTLERLQISLDVLICENCKSFLLICCYLKIHFYQAERQTDSENLHKGWQGVREWAVLEVLNL